MTQFATADELAARLGVEFTDDETTRANTLLELASGTVQAAARQHIELVTDDQLTMPGTRETAILLPERPVVAATASINGVQVTDFDVRDEEALVRRGGWGGTSDTVTVTYTHGYDPVPDAIKALTLEAVVRVWVNPGSVMAERYGSEQVTYLMGAADTMPTGLLLTKVEQETVRRVTRRGTRSMGVR
jgi:hypothetical protein